VVLKACLNEPLGGDCGVGEACEIMLSKKLDTNFVTTMSHEIFCLGVCVRERERKRQRDRERVRETHWGDMARSHCSIIWFSNNNQTLRCIDLTSK
jgi:hypothetical protein